MSVVLCLVVPPVKMNERNVNVNTRRITFSNVIKVKIFISSSHLLQSNSIICQVSINLDAVY